MFIYFGTARGERCAVVIMIRSFKEKHPIVPASCFVDVSAQVVGDVVLGENASVWMNAVLRGDVHEIRIGGHSNGQDCSVTKGMNHHYGV
jgi:carbonic anhydrase/acetyltransferase-like protein (isoleucine patch superfamily)